MVEAEPAPEVEAEAEHETKRGAEMAREEGKRLFAVATLLRYPPSTGQKAAARGSLLLTSPQELCRWKRR